VRYNTELEQAQRVLSARVEEASLQARHAALEADMNRCSGAPLGPFFWYNFGGPKCWKKHRYMDQNAGKHIINGWKTHHQWLENTSLMRVLDNKNGLND